MKHILLILTVFFSILTMQAAEPIKIGIITDLHYLSPQLVKKGAALDAYTSESGRTIQYADEILDQVFDFYKHTKKTDILLISGDLTKDGEKQSHIDLANRLKDLKSNGIQVYVIPGNHDINIPKSVGFDGDQTYKTDNITAEEFTHIYSDHGYSSAIKRDTASLSYVVELRQNKTWLLAIDAAKYEEYTKRAITSGRIKKNTKQWIDNILLEAKERNIRVIGMMHWGLVEHLPYQSALRPQYLVENWKQLASEFADKGLELIFTGHFHTNDISSHQSESGNTIYDIETGALISYPYAYRYAELYTDRIDISTYNVKSIPSNQNIYEENKEQIRTLANKIAIGILSKYELEDNSTTRAIAMIIADIFIEHAKGDEILTDRMKQTLRRLSSQMDTELDLSDIQLDFPPTDNNLTIPLKQHARTISIP